MDTEQITGVMPTLALWVTEFGLKAAEQARRALSELRRRADRPAASRSAPARALPRRDRAHLEAERVRGGSALNVQRALLVRHCESSGQAPDAPLTARGSVQAEALADFLAKHAIARIVSSPYLRARQSVEPLARKLGVEIELDPRLAERRLSPAPIDGWRELVRRSFDDPELRAPGGESGAETLARGLAAIRPLLESASADRLVVVASHGQLLGLVLHSIDARFGFAGWQALSNPDVHALEANATTGLAFRRVWG